MTRDEIRELVGEIVDERPWAGLPSGWKDTARELATAYLALSARVEELEGALKQAREVIDPLEHSPILKYVNSVLEAKDHA